MTQLKAWMTLLLTMTFVISPAFTSPFSGFSEDQLPIAQIDPPVQPAGYAFSIWGLIYAWLVVSAIFGVWKRRADPGWDAVRWALIISLAVGTPWLAVANQSPVWATVMIFIMAGAAIGALLATPRDDRWLLQAPVAIYAGWLTAASFVSLGTTAAGYGVLTDALGWAYIGIVLALIVALLVQRAIPRAPEYGLTVIWALVAIVVSNRADPLGVSIAAAIGILVIGALIATIYRPATTPG